jgi:hypothetical protein
LASRKSAFKERAEQVLWCYGNAERLARRGLWTVAVDEIPNLQVLERSPIRRAIPGSIEQQEFEYTRHGTVNLLLFLVVHTGRMEIVVEARRPEPHGGRHGEIVVGVRGGVASSPDAGPRLVAEPGRAAGKGVRAPLPEAGLVVQS